METIDIGIKNMVKTGDIDLLLSLDSNNPEDVIAYAKSQGGISINMARKMLIMHQEDIIENMKSQCVNITTIEPQKDSKIEQNIPTSLTELKKIDETKKIDEIYKEQVRQELIEDLTTKYFKFVEIGDGVVGILSAVTTMYSKYSKNDEPYVKIKTNSETYGFHLPVKLKDIITEKIVGKKLGILYIGKKKTNSGTDMKDFVVISIPIDMNDNDIAYNMQLRLKDININLQF